MLLMCLEVLGEGFFCFPGRYCKLLRKAWPQVLGMKYISEFKHGFTNRGCLSCATLKVLHSFWEKRAQELWDTQFFLGNVQNEIFKIFKMLQDNMKFTWAACWIYSKIRNRNKNSTLIIFLFRHYYWSLLWCSYSKFLKSAFLTFQKKLFYLFQWKPFKSDKKCLALLVLKILMFIFIFLSWLFGHVKKRHD